jgi:hypothetical protein
VWSVFWLKKVTLLDISQLTGSKFIVPMALRGRWPIYSVVFSMLLVEMFEQMSTTTEKRAKNSFFCLKFKQKATNRKIINQKNAYKT